MEQIKETIEYMPEKIESMNCLLRHLLECDGVGKSDLQNFLDVCDLLRAIERKDIALAPNYAKNAD